MGAEPADARCPISAARTEPADRDGHDAAATFATRTLPVLRALDAVLAEDPAGLAFALNAAEAIRPGVTGALVRGFATEAAHLRDLACRAEAAVARLRALDPAHRSEGCPVAAAAPHNA